MKSLSRSLILAAAVSGIGSSVLAAEPTYQELQQQLQQLQSRVDQLESKPTSKASVDATVDRVLKDAERRSQLLADGSAITAGYDRGFFIKSEDGNFVLRPGILFQFRNVTNYRSEADDLQNGFELRRLRPRFDGNFLTPDLTYSVVLDTNRSGGGISLLDAWGQYKFASNWGVKFGQFRESWFHEGDVPDSNQLTVERSLVDSILGGSQVDRVQGISLIYGSNNNPIRTEVTYHDGANSKNTDFRDIQPGATPADPPVFVSNFGGGFRFEYKAFGDWANYRDFTAKGNKQSLLIFGTGADATQVGDTTVYRTTADVQWENTTGWNAYGALNGNFTEIGTAAGDTSRADFGALAQVGYLIQPKVELFGRYDIVQLDDDFVAGENTFNEFALGANYYFGKDGSYLHRAKFTLDVLYLPEGAPSNQTGTGVLANPGEDEIVVRGQLQFVL